MPQPLEVGYAAAKWSCVRTFKFSLRSVQNFSSVLYCILQSSVNSSCIRAVAHEEINQSEWSSNHEWCPVVLIISLSEHKSSSLFPHCFHLSSHNWFVCSSTHSSLYCKIEISVSICPLKAGWLLLSSRPMHFVLWAIVGTSKLVGPSSLVCKISMWYTSLCSFQSLFNLCSLDGKSVLLEIKFCFCNEASFGLSAS